jgi:hypothetical protein
MCYRVLQVDGLRKFTLLPAQKCAFRVSVGKLDFLGDLNVDAL